MRQFVGLQQHLSVVVLALDGGSKHHSGKKTLRDFDSKTIRWLRRLLVALMLQMHDWTAETIQQLIKLRMHLHTSTAMECRERHVRFVSVTFKNCIEIVIITKLDHSPCTFMELVNCKICDVLLSYDSPAYGY